jgi:GntR family transcriptional regulator
MEMFSNINIHSSVAVYVQIENQVQFAIAAGHLQAGDRLPSVQKLAKEIGVNPNTVAKAYRDLEVMGYLYTRRGMGVFIEKGIDAKCRESVRRQTLQRMHEVVAEAKAAGVNKEEVRTWVQKCLASDTQPYQDAPASLLAAAKPGKKGK